MKSYIYLGITYHKKNGYYYIDGKEQIRFKTQETICDYIEDIESNKVTNVTI